MRVLKELIQALRQYPLWTRLAVMDIRESYRRSLIGALWILISFGMFIAVKIFIFGSFVSDDIGARVFTAHVVFGFWLWLFISDCLIDGANVFVRSRNWILGTDISLGVFVFQSISRIALRFTFAFPVVVAILIMDQWVPHVLWLTSLLGVIVFFLNAVWVHIFFGILCSQYRDFGYFLQALLRVLFFLTPILYLPSQLGSRAFVMQYNPLTHYIATVRDPIVSGVFPVFAWQIVGIITICGWGVALYALSKHGRRVAFWV